MFWSAACINLLLCRLDKRPRCHRIWRGARFNDWRQRDPWLVGTDDLERYQRISAPLRKVVAAMLSVYPYLENYVDARNHVAKAWLHWLGLPLEDPAPYGVLGLPFHRFYMEKKLMCDPTIAAGATFTRSAACLHITSISRVNILPRLLSRMLMSQLPRLMTP